MTRTESALPTLRWLSIALVLALALGCDVEAPIEDSGYLEEGTVRVELDRGSGAGFGSLSAIYGEPTNQSGSGTLDVLSLGNGGEITIDLGDRVLVDGEGADFIVHENSFVVSGDPRNPFAEVAVVEVSQDGKTFFTFPFDYNPEGKTVRERFVGFAGIDPAGDRFDLRDVGLTWARYIRIRDAGKASLDGSQSPIRDDDDEFLDDPGNICCGGNSQGFDLDAITLIHLGERPR